VAEWTRLHTLRRRLGYLAPDLWVTEQIFQFPPDEPTVRSVVVRNRGDMPLELHSIQTTDSAYGTTTPSLSVAPGQGDFFEVSFAPPAMSPREKLCIVSNDPDPVDAEWSAGLLAETPSLLGVGDTLNNSFAFLDPSGQNQLSGLTGNVVVLAYFALF
jgi:hypothetical protein